MRIAILGAGGMGGVHARQYAKMPEVELMVSDLDPARAQDFSQRTGARPVSLEEALSQADAVDVCTPTDSHRDLALRAIAAGRAVFVEKPLAGSLEDARAIRDAASKAGVPVMPGQVVRFFPEFATARQAVVSGAIGDPGAARTRRGGLAPKGADGWFQDHSRSGGVLLDLAIHDFDWLRWTLGEVEKVYARSVGASKGHGPDYGLATLTFRSGAVAHVEATWMDPSGFRTAFEVCGSKGMVQFDSRQNAALRASVGDGSTAARTAAESPLAATDDPYYRQLSAFVASVKDGVQPPVTADDGVAALSIALAALESSRTGRVVHPDS